MITPPSLDLSLINLAQVIDVGDIAGDGALDHLDAAADGGALGHSVRGGDGLDADHADARVVLPAVVHPVAQIAQPRLQRRTVVLRHRAAVCHDARRPRYRRPAAVRRDECQVHVRV
jgi:hypothetical protein